MDRPKHASQLRFSPVEGTGIVALLIDNPENSPSFTIYQFVYPQQGQMVGRQERNVENAAALNAAAETLNAKLLELAS